MTKKSDAPAIRFKGFSDAWEQRKFSDVVATRRGLTYKPSDIRKNGVRVLRSSNIAEDSFVLSDEVVEPQVQEIRAIGTVILIGMHLLKLRIKSMQIRVKKR